MGRVFFNTRENVHTLDSGYSTYQVLASDSGKTFVLQSASAMTITLPADADIDFGWHCRFLVNLDNNAAYNINCSDVTDSTGQMFDGGFSIQVIGNAAASIFQGAIVPAGDDSSIILDTNLADNGAKQGSWIDIIYVESSRFLVSGHIHSGDTDGDGSAIFANV